MKDRSRRGEMRDGLHESNAKQLDRTERDTAK